MLVGCEVFKDIVSILLHFANVGLVEVFYVISEKYIEDAVIIYCLTLQESSLLLRRGYCRPKFMITLTPLASPLSIPPWVSQLEDSNRIAFYVLQLCSIDLDYKLCTRL